MQLSTQFDSFDGVPNHHCTPLSRFLNRPSSHAGESFSAKHLNNPFQPPRSDDQLSNPSSYTSKLPSLSVPNSLNCKTNENDGGVEYNQAPSFSSAFHTSLHSSNVSYSPWPKSFSGTARNFNVPASVSHCLPSNPTANSLVNPLASVITNASPDSSTQVDNVTENVSIVRHDFNDTLYKSLTCKNPSSFLHGEFSNASIPRESLDDRDKGSWYPIPQFKNPVELYMTCVPQVSYHSVTSPEYPFSLKPNHVECQPKSNDWKYQLCGLKDLHLEDKQAGYFPEQNITASVDGAKEQWCSKKTFRESPYYETPAVSRSTCVGYVPSSTMMIFSGSADSSPYKTVDEHCAKQMCGSSPLGQKRLQNQDKEENIPNVVPCPISSNLKSSALSKEQEEQQEQQEQEEQEEQEEEDEQEEQEEEEEEQEEEQEEQEEQEGKEQEEEEESRFPMSSYKVFDEDMFCRPSLLVESESNTHPSLNKNFPLKHGALGFTSSLSSSEHCRVFNKKNKSLIDPMSSGQIHLNETTLHEEKGTLGQNKTGLALCPTEIVGNDSGHITSNVSIKVRSVISEWKAGTIIGRQGCSINDLRQKYRCKVTVSSDTTHADRILTVAGPWPRVACAFAKICSILTSGRNVDGQPAKLLSTGVDKVRSTELHDFSKETESKEPCSMSVCSGTGHQNDVPTVNSLNDAPSNELPIHKRRLRFGSPFFSYPPSIVSTMLEVFDLEKSDDPVFTNPFTFILSIPSSQCGCLIGRGGGQIRELRQKFLVSFNIAPISSYHGLQERLISISGLVENVAWCLTEVCRLLSLSVSSPFFVYPSGLDHFSPEKNLEGQVKPLKTSHSLMHSSVPPSIEEVKTVLPLHCPRFNGWGTSTLADVEGSDPTKKKKKRDTLHSEKPGTPLTTSHPHESSPRKLLLATSLPSLTFSSGKETMPLSSPDVHLMSPLCYKGEDMTAKRHVSKNTMAQKFISSETTPAKLSYGARYSRGRNQRSTAEEALRPRHLGTTPGSPNDELFPRNVEEHSYTLPNGEVEVHLRVPNDIVGCIIGKGGRTISEIRNTTETFISITETVSPSCEYPYSESPPAIRPLYPTRFASQRSSVLKSGGVRQRTRIICIRGPPNNVRTARFLMGSSILSAQGDQNGQPDGLNILPLVRGTRSAIPR